MGHPRVVPLLIKTLRDRPGLPVDREELADATGLTIEQVRDNMRNLIVRGRLPGTLVLTPGYLWQYDPDHIPPTPATPAASGRRVFEEVGPIRDGGLVLQDEEGNLWKAVEL